MELSVCLGKSGFGLPDSSRALHMVASVCSGASVFSIMQHYVCIGLLGSRFISGG